MERGVSRLQTPLPNSPRPRSGSGSRTSSARTVTAARPRTPAFRTHAFRIESPPPRRQHAGVPDAPAVPLRPPNPRRVLVVDLGFLGDTIHLIPALHEVRRHHPAAALHVVTTPVGAEVLGLMRGLDRVWVYPLGRPSPPWWRHLGLQWGLARERFDVALNFSGADRTLFVTAFAGVRCRVTRAVRPYRFWQRWLAGTVIPAPSRRLPVYEQRRQVLAAVGYELQPPRFDLEVPPIERAWANDRVMAGAIHLSINASSPFKEWPVTRWAELGRLLLARPGTSLVATGSPQPREQTRLAELAAAVANPRLVVLPAPLSIARLAGVLARCAAHVGTDSGVTHLALALGRPTVSVFRDYAGLEEWRPHGPGHAAAISPCQCVDRPVMAPDCVAAGTAQCLARITAEEVAALIPR